MDKNKLLAALMLLKALFSTAMDVNISLQNLNLAKARQFRIYAFPIRALNKSKWTRTVTSTQHEGSVSMVSSKHQELIAR